MSKQPDYVYRRIEDVRETVLAGFDIPEAKNIADSGGARRPGVPVEYKLDASASERAGRVIKSFVDRILGDGMVIENLTQIDPTKGLRMPKLNKIVIEGPVAVDPDDPLALYPRMDDRNGILTIAFSRQDPVKDITRALVIALRQPPKKVEQELNELGRRLVDEGLLRPEDVQRAEDVGSWRDFRPDGYSGGRSAGNNIQELEYEGVVYDRLKLKGVVRNMCLQPGSEIHELSVKTEGHFVTGEAGIHDDGSIEVKAYNNPEGGLTYPKAVQEENGFLAFHRKGRAGVLVIGKAKYPEAIVNGEATGYTMTLTPKDAVCVGDEILGAIKEEYSRFKSGTIDAPMARIRINGILMRMGRALREAHDDGLFHGYPSPDNIINVGGEYKFKDFHQSADVSGATEQKRVACRVHDIAANLRHLGKMLSETAASDEGHYIPGFLRMMGVSPAEYVLRGYFHDRPGDHRRQGIRQADVEQTFMFFTGVNVQPNTKFMTMVVDTVRGNLPAEHATSADIRIVPIIRRNSAITLPEAVTELQSRHEKLLRLSEQGFQELVFTDDDGLGRVVRDEGTRNIVLYYPQGADKTQIRQWLDRTLDEFGK